MHVCEIYQEVSLLTFTCAEHYFPWIAARKKQLSRAYLPKDLAFVKIIAIN